MLVCVAQHMVLMSEFSMSFENECAQLLFGKCFITALGSLVSRGWSVVFCLCTCPCPSACCLEALLGASSLEVLFLLEEVTLLFCNK